MVVARPRGEVPGIEQRDGLGEARFQLIDLRHLPSWPRRTCRYAASSGSWLRPKLRPEHLRARGTRTQHDPPVTGAHVHRGPAHILASLIFHGPLQRDEEL